MAVIGAIDLLDTLHLDGLDELTEAIIDQVRDQEVDLCLIGGDFNDWRSRAEQHLNTDLGLDELFVQLRGRHARTYPVWAPMLGPTR